LVHLHGLNLTAQLGPPRIDLGEPSVMLLRDIGEALGTLFRHFSKAFSTLLLCLLEHLACLGQHAFHRRLQQVPHLTPHRPNDLFAGKHHKLYRVGHLFI
jgi:hypothetical protein